MKDDDKVSVFGTKTLFFVRQTKSLPVQEFLHFLGSFSLWTATRFKVVGNFHFLVQSLYKL